MEERRGRNKRVFSISIVAAAGAEVLLMDDLRLVSLTVEEEAL